MLSILKKIPVIKIFLRNNFIFKKSVFKTIINYISTRRTFLVNWVSKWWIYVLILTPFASILSHIYMCGITVDPNPQSSWIRIQYGSRSTTLLKIVPDCLNSCRVCQALLFSFKKMCVLKNVVFIADFFEFDNTFSYWKSKRIGYAIKLTSEKWKRIRPLL